MKKILASLALLVSALYTLSAIPAYPGKIRVTQPDGSVITIQIHGDEWFHYITDESGQVVAQDADGFYRRAPMPTPEQREEAARMRRAAHQMRASASALARGEHRIPVVLVNFSDKEFVIQNPASTFSDMLNLEGYSRGGATGSVRDFYVENSHGQYQPSFEVFGPVTLSKTSEYYAYNKTGRASQALREACELLDEVIDFSQYDSDGDGSVDMILMYYAGHNQAEGGGTDTIWPHQSYASGRFDGKNLSRYFCTSELSGAYGNSMCGIGTTTHEFGHSLGLPDFYDTDYEENGQAGALYSFSTMCSGSYNNNGRTPPYFNSEELRILGWMGGQSEIPSQGVLTLPPVQNLAAYRTATTMEGEYFVYECRTQSGWDRFLPSGGLLVYHVDKANRESLLPNSGGWANYYIPANLWNYWSSTNSINAIGSHPCFYLVPAADQNSLNYGGSQGNIPFPGNRRVTNYKPVDWQGSITDFRFSDIAYDGTKVTMTVHYTSVPGVGGIVRNTAAKPVRGATVSLYAEAAAPAPSGERFTVRRRAAGTPLFTVTTDVDGSYSMEDASLADGTFTLVVTCDGYVEAETTVRLARTVETCDFYLRRVDEPEESNFMRYDPEGPAFVSVGMGSASVNHAAGIRMSAEEATALAGKQIKLISFQPSGSESSTVSSAYVFIEVGATRQFTQKVDNVRFNAMNTVNVVGQEFLIPAGSALYIGYALVDCNEQSPILAQTCDEDHAGFIARFNQTRANSWSLMQTGDGTYYTPVISASVGEPVQPEMGFNHIANPGNGVYAAGDRFELALVRYQDDPPSAVSWTFDGETVQADSVTLTAGSHAVEAHLAYPDGSVEIIRLVITAE